jgi:hypothetical protein
MAVPDPKSPDTAVRVQPGDTLSAIAKANGLTLTEIKALNPTLVTDPKYNGGNLIFSNTKVNIAPAATTSYAGSGSGVDTTTLSGIAKASGTPAADTSAADAAAKAAADAAAAKAAQDAAAKAAADAAAQAAADKTAADAAAAAAKTDAEKAAAKAAQDAADAAAARAAADAANAARGNSNNYSYPASGNTNVGSGNINTSGNVQLASVNAADTSAADYAKAQAALEKEQARQSTIAVMQARFAQYNLGTLADKIKALAIDGATEATITLQLAETPEYQARFKANADRVKNNLQVLTPAEYLNLEDGYRQVLRSYGLTQFANDEYVTQFIANDVSATELTNRVNTAVTRIQNADPSVTTTLRDYYGITQPDLIGYILDPAQNINTIQKKISAAEIGSAASLQGLQSSVGVSEALANQGVTQQQAQTGYATIAGILPTAEKLSQIYGGTTDAYGQSTAEQEVFNNLASAQRARQKLTAKEIANFSGSSGTSKGAFSTGYLNKQSAAGQF